ncbi:MAG: GNAT family N-acetyltransferase [Chloroflexota bacterium]|nr:GNAT family N-acetyltransferase [Chloroflexota bacterium]
MSDRLARDGVSVLVISGPGGVGKSAAAYELSLLLQGRDIGHAVVDTDALDHLCPVPPDLPRLTEHNLAAIWESYRERGVSRLILTGVYLDRPAEMAWLKRAIPNAAFTFVRLLSGKDTLLARVARRELGSGQAAQGERSAQQLAAMAADQRPEVHELQTDDRSVTEIAGRLLARSGWGGEVSVRRATPDDADAFADVHARSWQVTYRGLVPDAVIEGVMEGRAARVDLVRTMLAAADDPHHLFAAVEGEVLVGMAATAPARDPDASAATGELQAIYLAPEAIGRGIGRVLHDRALADLRERGFTEATLWVLRENQRARHFYEAAGWQTDGETKDEERPGGTLHEIRYRRALT